MEKREKMTKEKKSARPSRTNPAAKKAPPQGDVSQVYSILQKVIPEVEKKKIKEPKDGKGDEKYSHLSNWSFIRPNMSLDYAVEHPAYPPTISVIPWQSQENIILDDLLTVLLGFQGKFIFAQPLSGKYDPRVFTVADSLEPTLRRLVQQILPLASDHSIVTRFIEEKRQLKWGRVNQALASAMDKLLTDYAVFISQLETLLRKNQLTLQNIWFYLQSTIQTFQVLAKIVNNINELGALGGRTLTILHEETLHYMTDNNAQQLCMHLTAMAADPYFDSLQQWLHKGNVFDPYEEFLIQDNVELEKDANSVTGQYSDEYWSKRYTINDENVPVFLIPVQEIVLRTGRYLNVVRQCSETTKSSGDFVVPPLEKIAYSIHGEEYLNIIESAYHFASSTLLDLLLTNYDIINRIKSLKRYFLMEQGDFIVQLLDLCEEELSKQISEVVPSRLQSLFELALRTSTGKHDPYKEDITLTFLTQNNTYQILKIQTIGNEQDEKININHEQALSKTGLEGFAFQVISKWPLSLLFNQKIIGCYQMLFRHLVHCKHVDRRLCRVWISDKAVKQLPTSAAAGYLGAFSLRQRMLFCIQNLEYYMMEEAIEPNWIRFMSRVSTVRNIDDLLAEHWDFVDQCMKDCMFMNHDLIDIINKILAACIEFCDFIQRMQRYFLDAELTSMLSPDDRPYDSLDTQCSESVYSKAVENQSFENNIKRLDTKFTGYLAALLTTISSMGQEATVEKLHNIFYRENFNGFYSSNIEKDYRGSDSLSSIATSG